MSTAALLRQICRDLSRVGLTLPATPTRGTGWTVEVTAEAFSEIANKLELDSNLEVAGVLFGDVDTARHRVRVSGVLPNLEPPRFRDRVAIELRRAGGWDNEFNRICGDVHSHPSGNREASRADLDSCERHATGLKSPYVGLIVTPRAFRRDPVGEQIADWVRPQITAWVAEPGAACRQATVHVQREE